MSESFDQTKKRAAKIVRLLKKHYPDSFTALKYRTPHQLLVSTILSAQCTDERVNMVTPGLFKKYPNVQAFAYADLEELAEDIRSTGFFRNKAKAIKTSAQELMERHGGEVPRTLDELVKLSGVGRKTASVILGNAYQLAEGVVVDTHVGRLSRRLGLTEHKDPVKVERDLMELIPRKDWILLSHMLIDHGRAICNARKPKCCECFLAKLCPSAECPDRSLS
jgi:endonuclease-3